jgi:hypothetical protein
MPQKMWEDPLLDARGAGTPGHNRLYRAACLSRRLSMSAASVRTSGRRDNLPVFPGDRHHEFSGK